MTVCHILHFDMDAFFAAVEQLDNPSLRGLPVIVGAPPDRRGVVCTASYEARKFGVRSAMPSRTAYRLCPHGVFLPVRMARYAELSRRIMAICERLTPVIEQVSVDEAFLDVAGLLKRRPCPVDVARQLRLMIRDETGLTASVGVAPNKFLAKLASDFRKPDGLTVVPADERDILAFLAPLPVTRIWGVGQVTGRLLAEAGIRTIGQLQLTPQERLCNILGPRAAWNLQRLALGRDDRPVVVSREEKSISNELTFEHDCQDPELLRQTLIELAEKVGRRLRQAGKLAATAHVKLRFHDFTTVTRQQAMQPATASDRLLVREALTLFEREEGPRPLRLIGFGVSKLSGGELAGSPRQPLLFSDPSELMEEADQRNAELDSVVDDLRERYGVGILRRGRWDKGGGRIKKKSRAGSFFSWEAFG